MSITFKDLGDLLFKVFELERSQEPERTEMEGHHRRDGLLEERGCVEKGPVSAEADDEVDLVRQIVLLFVERHQLVAHLKKTQSGLMNLSSKILHIFLTLVTLTNVAVKCYPWTHRTYIFPFRQG